MNRIFTTFLFLGLAGCSLLAQINGNGYYRVISQGLQIQTQQDYYCCVNHNQVYINKQSVTNQAIHAIQLVSSDYVANSDPSAVLYISDAKSKNNFNILAQGCNLRNMLNPESMQLVEHSNGDYSIIATKEGVSLSLKNQTNINEDRHHYMCSTGGEGSIYWKIYPVNSDSEYDWFGIQPTLTAGDKHYASFFAGFPFRCKSAGMKVFYVSAADDNHYELKEIQDIVPASTPVLIECSSSDPKKNLIDILEPNSGTKISGNKLKGVYFCNQYLGKTNFQGFITPFDASAMRVWTVKDNKLVLSTDESGLFKGTFTNRTGTINYKNQLFIKANSSYLPVAASANSVLTEGTVTALDNVDASEVTIKSITNIAGQKVNSFVHGVNIITYSDGTVKKVIK